MDSATPARCASSAAAASDWIARAPPMADGEVSATSLQRAAADPLRDHQPARGRSVVTSRTRARPGRSMRLSVSVRARIRCTSARRACVRRGRRRSARPAGPARCRGPARTAVRAGRRGTPAGGSDRRRRWRRATRWCPRAEGLESRWASERGSQADRRRRRSGWKAIGAAGSAIFARRVAGGGTPGSSLIAQRRRCPGVSSLGARSSPTRAGVPIRAVRDGTLLAGAGGSRVAAASRRCGSGAVGEPALDGRPGGDGVGHPRGQHQRGQDRQHDAPRISSRTIDPAPPLRAVSDCRSSSRSTPTADQRGHDGGRRW